MSLLEINPDVRRLTAAAERIAWALEQILLQQYGVSARPAKSIAESAKDIILGAAGKSDDVLYSSDIDTARRDLEQAVRPEAVREREGTDVEEEVGRG